MPHFEIKNRFDGLVIYQDEAASFKALVEAAVKAKAPMSGADLSGADLSWADLYGANLSWANLYEADLSWANLYGANLYEADLYEADLSGADLSGANLYGANLYGAKNAELIMARTSIVPETGGFQGWKQCRNGVIVRLRIPARAKRSCATGRKCRASEALVLQVIGAEVGRSHHDSTFEYRKGQIVQPKGAFDENRWNECGSGIHFYLTRIEAENHG